MRDLEGIFPARVSAHLLERLPDELSHVENGTLFVAWPKPPRVGRRVRVELSFGDEPPVSLDALVVWARPPRPGVVGGFRAQLDQPSPEVLTRLRDVVEVVRQRLMLRDVGNARPARPSAAEPFVITERVRVRSEPTPGPKPLQFSTPLSVPRPEPEPVEEEATGLELDSSPHGGWRGSLPAFEPPPGQPALDLELDFEPPDSAPPEPVPTGPETVDDLFAGLAEELKAEPPPAAPAPVAAPPVRVPYANSASYRMHYERFLQHGEVYVTTAPAPPVGSRCALLLLVPDGEPPVAADAIAVREVQPPEVPVRGWVAALVDPDGHVAERLATASFVLAD